MPGGSSTDGSDLAQRVRRLFQEIVNTGIVLQLMSVDGFYRERFVPIVDEGKALYAATVRCSDDHSIEVRADRLARAHAELQAQIARDLDSRAINPGGMPVDFLARMGQAVDRIQGTDGALERALERLLEAKQRLRRCQSNGPEGAPTRPEDLEQARVAVAVAHEELRVLRALRSAQPLIVPPDEPEG